MGIGKNMTRVDAFDKVTGSARYTADLEPQGLLVAKVIRSTIANGVVKSFDLEEARKVPGVVKIVTCFDVPDIQFPTPAIHGPWKRPIRILRTGNFSIPGCGSMETILQP